MNGGPAPRVADRIIAAINQKLERNRSELDKSRFGRVIWRVDKNGKVDIDLEPRI